jgi:hypothetical protein
MIIEGDRKGEEQILCIDRAKRYVCGPEQLDKPLPPTQFGDISIIRNTQE